MNTYTVILVRGLNDRKTITVEATSYPGARTAALEQFPSWEIRLVTRLSRETALSIPSVQLAHVCNLKDAENNFGIYQCRNCKTVTIGSSRDLIQALQDCYAAAGSKVNGRNVTSDTRRLQVQAIAAAALTRAGQPVIPEPEAKRRADGYTGEQINMKHKEQSIAAAVQRYYEAGYEVVRREAHSVIMSLGDHDYSQRVAIWQSPNDGHIYSEEY